MRKRIAAGLGAGLMAIGSGALLGIANSADQPGATHVTNACELAVRLIGAKLCGPAAPSPIEGIELTNTSFLAGAPAGTTVGTVIVHMTSGEFSGSLRLAGHDAASFQLAGHDVQTRTAGLCSTGAPCTFALVVIANQPAATANANAYAVASANARSVPRSAPYAQPVTLTATAAPGSTPPAAEKPGPSAALFAHPWYQCVHNRYISNLPDSGASDSNDGQAAKLEGGHGPWATVQHASDAGLQAGECINLVASPAPYEMALAWPQQVQGGTWSPTGLAVWRCTALLGCTWKAPGNLGGTATIMYPSFSAFDGFVLDDNNQPNHATTPAGEFIHHALFANIECYHAQAHCFNGTWGLTGNVDFFFVVHSHAHHSQLTGWFSGINSYAPPVAAPTNTQYEPKSYRIMLLYNIVHDITETAEHSTDGNGLILDNTSPTYDGHKILVLGNVAYNNGGKGFHNVGSQSHVWAHNTSYNNNLDPANSGTFRGEYTCQHSYNTPDVMCTGNQYLSNIGYAVPGAGILAHNSPWLADPGSTPNNSYKGNVSYGAANVMYGGDEFKAAENKPDVDPKFVDAGAHNFALQAGSPASGYVTAVPDWPPASPQFPTAAVPNSAGACDSSLTQCP